MDNKILYLGMLGLVFVSFIVFHITKVNELNQQTIFLTSQINNLNNEVKSKLRPNQFIDQIDYVDGENARRGTVTVTGGKYGNGRCGYMNDGLDNVCSFYFNVYNSKDDETTTSYLLFSRTFGPFSYKSMKQINSDTFEITVEGGDGLCGGENVYTMGIVPKGDFYEGVLSKLKVDIACEDGKGKIINRYSYSTTTGI